MAENKKANGMKTSPMVDFRIIIAMFHRFIAGGSNIQIHQCFHHKN
jgi:hypothetical protein